MISCSARKEWTYHIRDWLNFHINYAKVHGDLEFGYDDIDYAFGFVEGKTDLWGGRLSGIINITKVDEYWLYDHGIGLKLPLSSRMFNDEMYKGSLPMLKFYHRKTPRPSRPDVPLSCPYL